MTSFNPKAAGFASLAGSVWVVTGGANGIGIVISSFLSAIRSYTEIVLQENSWSDLFMVQELLSCLATSPKKQERKL